MSWRDGGGLLDEELVARAGSQGGSNARGDGGD